MTPPVQPRNNNRAAAGVGLAASAVILAGLLIPHWEGRDLVAKHNAFDPKGVITVCDGVTNYDWSWLKEGMTFTAEQCQQALTDNIPKYAQPIAECVPSFKDMPPHRQAALISFAYNLGPDRICKSQIGKELNVGNTRRACDLMTQYTRANGVMLKGLVNRRTDAVWGERTWCLRED